MIIDLTQITDQLNRIESKIDKILEFDVKPPTVTPTPEPEPEPIPPAIQDFTEVFYQALKDEKVNLIEIGSDKIYRVKRIEKNQ